MGNSNNKSVKNQKEKKNENIDIQNLENASTDE